MQPLQVCIGPIIRIGRESWCLPYARFFSFNFQGFFNKKKLNFVDFLTFFKIYDFFSSLTF